MLSQVSSAEPEELYRYSNLTASMDQELAGESHSLAACLHRFESSCTEYSVHVSSLADGLRSLGQQAEEIDRWVHRVGRAFEEAGQSWWRGFAGLPLLPSIPALLLGFATWPSVNILASTLKVPPWLHLPSIGEHSSLAKSDQPVPTPVPTPAPDRPQGPDPITDREGVPAKPQSGSSPSGANAASEVSGVIWSRESCSLNQPVATYSINSKGSFPRYGANRDGNLHTGIDLNPVPAGTHPSVYPIGPGVVDRVGYEENGYGNYIVVKHQLADGSTIYTRYAHLQGLPDFRPGDIVTTDTELQKMGNTGHVQGITGVHLHVGIMKCSHPSVYDGFDPDADADSARPGKTNLEVAKEEYLDPEPFLTGQQQLEFLVPEKAE